MNYMLSRKIDMKLLELGSSDIPAFVDSIGIAFERIKSDITKLTIDVIRENEQFSDMSYAEFEKYISPGLPLNGVSIYILKYNKNALPIENDLPLNSISCRFLKPGRDGFCHCLIGCSGNDKLLVESVVNDVGLFMGKYLPALDVSRNEMASPVFVTNRSLYTQPTYGEIQRQNGSSNRSLLIQIKSNWMIFALGLLVTLGLAYFTYLQNR